MIDRLFEYFRGVVGESPDHTNNEAAINLAAVALMLEVARSDAGSDEVELKQIESIMQHSFEVSPEQIGELLMAATEQVEAAHDLFQFTQLINDRYSYGDKEKLIYAMWLVAHADGKIAAHEDHIIRRIAGLVHIAHEDFIRLKLKARKEYRP